MLAGALSERPQFTETHAINGISVGAPFGRPQILECQRLRFVGAHYSKAAYSIAIQIKDLVRCLSERPTITHLFAGERNSPLRKYHCRGVLRAPAPYVTFSPNTFYYRNSLLSARMRGGTSVGGKKKTGTKVGTFPLPTFPLALPFLSYPYLPTFATSSPSFDGWL